MLLGCVASPLPFLILFILFGLNSSSFDLPAFPSLLLLYRLFSICLPSSRVRAHPRALRARVRRCTSARNFKSLLEYIFLDAQSTFTVFDQHSCFFVSTWGNAQQEQKEKEAKCHFLQRKNQRKRHQKRQPMAIYFIKSQVVISHQIEIEKNTIWRFCSCSCNSKKNNDSQVFQNLLQVCG